ncbi:hypothetical protein L1887_55979 [Cichorium endivia]|nr:hypothetical protein L1887_55979 [Cichorium endivia]
MHMHSEAYLAASQLDAAQHAQSLRSMGGGPSGFIDGKCAVRIQMVGPDNGGAADAQEMHAFAGQARKAPGSPLWLEHSRSGSGSSASEEAQSQRVYVLLFLHPGALR